jgi:hypothetical protein
MLCWPGQPATAAKTQLPSWKARHGCSPSSWVHILGTEHLLRSWPHLRRCWRGCLQLPAQRLHFKAPCKTQVSGLCAVCVQVRES